MGPILRLAILAALATSVAAQEALKMGVIPGALRYDVSRFDVHAGQAVRIEFTNNGLMPHNLLVVRPGKADAVMLAAMAMGAEGMQKDYVPDSDDVLASTPILQPQQKRVVSFTAPTTPCQLQYLCTFPGHGTIMRGAIRVLPESASLAEPIRAVTQSPAPAEDRLANSGATAFPLGTRAKPYIIRTFMPDPGLSDAVLSHHHRGQNARPYDVNARADKPGLITPIDGLPAAIGVNFGGGLSICWDTIECRMLYAWTGGFLDLSNYWGAGAGGGRKSFGYVPTLVGNLIWMAEDPHPLLNAKSDPPRYLGHSTRESEPVFRYRLGDNSTVEETIEPGHGPFEIQITRVIHTPGLESILTGELITGVERRPDPVPYADLQRAGIVTLATRVDGRGERSVFPGAQAMAPGRAIFHDRTFEFVDMPETLIGADHVMTLNDDKKDTGQGVAWEIEVNAPCTLWVLMDERVQVPQWVTERDFEHSAVRVTTSGQWTYHGWKRDVPAGKHRLSEQSGGSFYAIAVSARGKEQPQ